MHKGAFVKISMSRNCCYPMIKFLLRYLCNMNGVVLMKECMCPMSV